MRQQECLPAVSIIRRVAAAALVTTMCVGLTACGDSDVGQSSQAKLPEVAMAGAVRTQKRSACGVRAPFGTYPSGSKILYGGTVGSRPDRSGVELLVHRCAGGRVSIVRRESVPVGRGGRFTGVLKVTGVSDGYVQTITGGTKGPRSYFSVRSVVERESALARSATSGTTAGFLGVFALALTPVLLEKAERDGHALTVREGLVIQHVRPGGPADQAGLRGASRGRAANVSGPTFDGDIITEINGASVRSGSELARMIRTRRPGEAIDVIVVRHGTRLRREITLGSS